jgi:hypothetical protein
MINELTNYIYPIAFTGCSFSKKYLIPCKEKVKLIATSIFDVKDTADKIAYFPLVKLTYETRVFPYCGNVNIPRFIDLSNLSKTKDILKARTLNPIIAKGVDNPEYEEIESYPFPVFAFAYGKPRNEIRIEKGMSIGFVNYFGGLGYVIKNNLHVLRNMKPSSEEVHQKDVVVSRASKVYYELYDEEVFVEDITDLGLDSIKMLENKFNLKFKIEKIGIYNISKNLEHLMKDPLAGDFNVIVIGKQNKVENFLEKFRKYMPSYLGGKVI